MANEKNKNSARTNSNSEFSDNQQLDTLIVIPCYNEEERLHCDTFLAYAEAHPKTGFVFVDDGSKDNTLSVLTQMRVMNHNQIEVVKLSKNSGKAEAVRTGLSHAASFEVDFLGYWDADLATPLDAIDDFQTIMKRFENVELVYGARKRLIGHRIYRTLNRRIISRICAIMARFAISMPVSDTQCGAKLFRNCPAFRTAISRPFKTDWLFDVELFARLAQLMPEPHHSFYEYPLSEWEEIAGSKINGTTVMRAGFSILELIARIRFLDKRMKIIDHLPPLPASAYVVRGMEFDAFPNSGPSNLGDQNSSKPSSSNADENPDDSIAINDTKEVA